MKKFITMLLIALTLSINIVKAEPQIKPIQLTEGVYEASKFDIPLSDLKYVANSSDNNFAYFIVFNDDETILQSIKLLPNSPKFELYPLSSHYRIVIIGNGAVVLS